MYEIPDVISENLFNILNNHLGQPHEVMTIKTQLKSLFGLIEVYSDNRFSSPSIELYLTNMVKNITTKFEEYKDAQVNANSLLLEIRTFKSKTKRGLISEEKRIHLSQMIDEASDEIAMMIQLYTEQLVFYLRSIQSEVSKEYVMVKTGVNLINIFKQRQKIKCDGKHYTVKFKLTQQDTLLGTKNNETKEEGSNDECKRKESE